jgi:hypothetical protein
VAEPTKKHHAPAHHHKHHAPPHHYGKYHAGADKPPVVDEDEAYFEDKHYHGAAQCTGTAARPVRRLTLPSGEVFW